MFGGWTGTRRRWNLVNRWPGPWFPSTAKEVSEQLIIDAAEYRQHTECKTLICLVHDPEGLIKNPRGIERDLAKLSGHGLEMVCVITP
jgi:REase_DpnII-MboI